MINEVRYDDICQMVGVSAEGNKLAARSILGPRGHELDLTYKVIQGVEREAVMLDILKHIDSDSMPKAGDITRWERGWGENLAQYQMTKDFNDLIPKFRTNHRICRYNDEFIVPTSPHLETAVYTTIDYLIYGEYLKNVSSTFDFGCGTGVSLKHVSELYPHMLLHGLDWSMKSVEIIESIREIEGINIHGQLFDMMNPNYDVVVPRDSAIITSGAMEQLGDNFEPFLQFMISKKPKVVIHFEPIVEFCEQTLFDYLIYKHVINRKYLRGYWTRLEKLESEGKIKIHKAFRVKLGSLYQEGNSLIIWSVL